MFYCCKHLTNDVNLPDTYTSYNKKFREFYLPLKYKTSIQVIWFCPWCGKELPRSLSRDWFEILEKEYGLEDPYHEDEHLVPEEFKSDEWWKKRDIKEILVPKEKIVKRDILKEVYEKKLQKKKHESFIICSIHTEELMY